MVLISQEKLLYFEYSSTFGKFRKRFQQEKGDACRMYKY